MKSLMVTVTSFLITPGGEYSAIDQTIPFTHAGSAAAAMRAAGRSILLGDLLAGPLGELGESRFFSVAHSDDPRWIDVLNMIIRDNAR